MSSSANYISQTYFLPLSASSFNSTITRLCRNHFCGSRQAIETNSDTRSGLHSPVGDPHAPTLENTLFKAWRKPEKWKSNLDKTFFLSLSWVFCVCHPCVSWLFQKRDLLVVGSQSRAHHPEPHVWAEVVHLPILVMLWERPAQRPSGPIWEQVFLAWYDALFHGMGQG